MAKLNIFILINVLALFVSSCSEIEPKPFEPSPTHIKKEQTIPTDSIPQLVEQEPILPEPQAGPDLERYTVVVNEVPVKELLFALARDAEINVDIAPDIEGVVTINAVEQTLPQILERLSNQVDMRYEFSGQNLIITADIPFLRTYTIDYVNMSRETGVSNTVATQIQSTSGGNVQTGNSGSSSSTTGGGNNSTTDVTSSSVNFFWRTLTLNVLAILETEQTQSGDKNVTTNVIPNPEAGLLMVRATESQHREIQAFIDRSLSSVLRQVLVRVTIAEVQLSDQYQAGIDWSLLQEATKAGIEIVSTTLTGVPLGTASSFVIDYQDPNTDREDRLQATISLLDEFGNVRVMSSPQTMVLNNQTALLKVVENVVYFEVDVEPGVVSLAGVTDPAIDTTAATVPVGIVMSVTPQISGADQISLNVRPTISRVTDFVNDPNPELAAAGVTNPVPQIEVREIESMLRLTNGQIAVLGGLMQDTASDDIDGLPLVKDTPLLGNLFKTTTKQYRKTELVIFIQPIIIRNPSLDGDLEIFQPYLNQSTAVPVNQETGES